MMQKRDAPTILSVRFRMNDGTAYEISLPIPSNETITQIKQKLEFMYHLKASEQTLHYNGIQLQDSESLSHYHYSSQFPIYITMTPSIVLPPSTISSVVVPNVIVVPPSQSVNPPAAVTDRRYSLPSLDQALQSGDFFAKKPINASRGDLFRSAGTNDFRTPSIASSVNGQFQDPFVTSKPVGPNGHAMTPPSKMSSIGDPFASFQMQNAKSGASVPSISNLANDPFAPHQPSSQAPKVKVDPKKPMGPGRGPSVYVPPPMTASLGYGYHRGHMAPQYQPLQMPQNIKLTHLFQSAYGASPVYGYGLYNLGQPLLSQLPGSPTALISPSLTRSMSVNASSPPPPQPPPSRESLKDSLGKSPSLDSIKSLGLTFDPFAVVPPPKPDFLVNQDSPTLSPKLPKPNSPKNSRRRNTITNGKSSLPLEPENKPRTATLSSAHKAQTLPLNFLRGGTLDDLAHLQRSDSNLSASSDEEGHGHMEHLTQNLWVADFNNLAMPHFQPALQTHRALEFTEAVSNHPPPSDHVGGLIPRLSAPPKADPAKDAERRAQATLDPRSQSRPRKLSEPDPVTKRSDPPRPVSAQSNVPNPQAFHLPSASKPSVTVPTIAPPVTASTTPRPLSPHTISPVKTVPSKSVSDVKVPPPVALTETSTTKKSTHMSPFAQPLPAFTESIFVNPSLHTVTNAVSPSAFLDKPAIKLEAPPKAPRSVVRRTSSGNIAFTAPTFVPETASLPPLSPSKTLSHVTFPEVSPLPVTTPTPVPVAPVPVPAIPEVHPKYCSVEGPWKTAKAGVPTQFTIIAGDSHGIPMKSGGSTFQVLLHGPAFLEAQVTDLSNGSYKVTWTPEVKGLYDMFVGVDGIQIAGSPFSVLASCGDVYAANCVATGDGLEKVEAGCTASFFIQSRDYYGNNCDQSARSFQVNIQGPENLKPIVRDNNGTYAVEYAPKKAGEYAISVLFDGTHITGSPFPVQAGAGVTAPSQCEAHGSGLNHATVGNSAEFSIRSRDEYGNPRTVGGDLYRIVIPKSRIQVRDNSDGSYKVTYQAVEGGQVEMHVTLHGTHIRGSPFKLNITGTAKKQASNYNLSKEDLAAAESERMAAIARMTSQPLSSSAPVQVETNQIPRERPRSLQPQKSQMECIIKAQACVRRWSAMKHFAHMSQTYSLRRQVALEILSSEKSYLAVLDILKEVFMDPLRKSLSGRVILTQDQIGIIFSNLPFLRSINGDLYQKLETRISKWSPSQLLGDIFVEMADSLQYSYSQYINNYDQALKMLSYCQQNEKMFQVFLESSRNHPTYGYIDIGAFLISPVQRLPRYELLLKELVKYTPPDNRDYLQLTMALAKIKDVTTYVNENRRKAENLHKIISIQNSLIGKTRGSLFHLNRIFVDEANVTMMRRGKKVKRYVFLFSDIILVTKLKKSRDSIKYENKEAISLDGAEFRLSNEANTFQVVVPGEIYTFVMESAVVLNHWVEAIKGSLHHLQITNKPLLKR
eukprot:TRINITY_DN7213_c0_g1_i1.p1 TRINITY_DN7213_c0_g1~~TRINITY_DN7213_c0_g1_i1.p1  ORF type:complete len:1482 (+),score=340.98 TRINITY_DN7213_c0_g1_i1:64-4509(+)